MDLEPTMLSAPPVAAWPLEYGNEALDPLLPVLRAVAVLLFIAGVSLVCLEVLQLISMGYRIFVGPQRAFVWTYLAEIPLGVLQIVAGAKNFRQVCDDRWIWAWIWASITLTLATQAFWAYRELFVSPALSVLTVTGSLLVLLLRVPVSASMPVCVAILLVYRRRLMMPQRAR